MVWWGIGCLRLGVGDKMAIVCHARPVADVFQFFVFFQNNFADWLRLDIKYFWLKLVDRQIGFNRFLD